MNDITIKVSTQVMVSQADAIRKTADHTKQLFERVREIVNGSRSYWEGEAQNKHLAALEKLQPAYEEISALLCSRTEKLLQMAGIYTESENMSVRDSQSLPSNIIM